MANKEQLAILKQGVAAWNKWREENPDAKIDLRGARLDKKNLNGANFCGADIRGTNFSKSSLVMTDFSLSISGLNCFGNFLYTLKDTILHIGTCVVINFIFILPILLISFLINIEYYLDIITNAIGILFLTECALSIALSFYFHYSRNPINCFFICDTSKDEFYYFSSNFAESNLTGSILCNSSIRYAVFNDAILTNTSWINAKDIQLASFNDAILKISDVREFLVRGSGQGFFLKGRNLKKTRLVEFDLRSTDLRGTDLRQADLSRADITGAKLYNAARENWIIDGIRCDYVYWDEAGEQRTPPDRDFRPGEFEELYKQLPSFEYVFANGFTPLDPLIMDRVVQAINEQHKEFSLELVNFDKRGQPHATFTVCRLDYVEKAKEQITAGYEASKGSPEQQAQHMAAVLGLIENQNKLIDKIPSSRELTMGDTYQIYGGQIGAIGQSASASGNIFQQITAELPRVHEEMRRSAASPEQKAAAEDVAKAAQAAQQQNEPAVRQHLKNAGKFALDCAQKIGAEALAEYLKKMTLGL